MVLWRFSTKLKWSILIIHKLPCQDFNDTENLLQQKRFQREGHSKFTARVQHSRVDWNDFVDILSQYIEKARFEKLFFQNQLNTVSWKFADVC